MKIKGMGGFWVVAENTVPLLPVGRIVHNATYEVAIREVVYDVLSVGCSGFVEGLPVCKRVEAASFRVAEDDAAFPEAIGYFTEGKEVVAYLKRGAADRWDFLYRSIVETVGIENDQTKARWLYVTLKRGYFIRDVNAPVITVVVA